MPIMTSSWSAKLPPGAIAVGISRGVPRARSSYKRLLALQPGPWFGSVGPREYLDRYNMILADLDPRRIADELLAFGETSVMLCYESAHDIDDGCKWCHRHIAAQWLEDRLGIEVTEVSYPSLDRFAFLRKAGLTPPDYREGRLRPTHRARREFCWRT